MSIVYLSDICLSGARDAMRNVNRTILFKPISCLNISSESFGGLQELGQQQ
jgi:hypothetical protein